MKEIKLIEKARALFNDKKYDLAKATINQIVTNNKEINNEKKLLEAALFLREDNIEESLKIIEELEKNYKNKNLQLINLKAIASRAKKDFKGAKLLLEDGLKDFPNSIDLTHNLSVTYADLGDMKNAEKFGLRAIKLNPKNIETYKNLGRVYINTREINKAQETFKNLNEIDPKSVDVLVGLGAIELLKSNPVNAKKYFEEALRKNNNLNAAWANLGVCKKYLNDYIGAKKDLETAIQKEPNQIEHVWNLALVNLALGNFKDGWQQYEVRYDPRRIATDAVKLPKTPIPQLKNADNINGKTIVLVQEQGFGDTFQFFRLSKQLKQEGVNKIIAIVSKEMHEVIKSIPWIDEVRTEMEKVRQLPHFWTFSMSLPARYNYKSIDDIPKFEQYILANEEQIDLWKKEIITENDNIGKLKVGLVWAGRETHSNDSNRSMDLNSLEPLFELKNHIEFISLQKGPKEMEGKIFPELKLMGSKLENFSDTAAVLANLDLLISVDSSPIHLAGAMGMPVWVMIPSIFDFRWLIDRVDSPWYPTMKLFRQRQGESWFNVIAQIRSELEVMIQSPTKSWVAERYIQHPGFSAENPNCSGLPLFLHSAFKYHLEGNSVVAEQMYKKCLKYEPKNLEALRNLAVLYRTRGELDLSLACYQKGEEYGFDDSIFYTNYANLLMQLGRYNDGLHKARRALRLNPQHQPALTAEKQCLQAISSVASK